MKQLLVLSGKGGTGKTTVATSFVRLSGTHAFADCDVDAPNLHLSTQVNAPVMSQPFEGMPRAVINEDNCISCGVCSHLCRFGAIDFNRETRKYVVDRLSCEGCRVCLTVCPTEAITLTDEVIGQTDVYADESQIFSTAQLQAGSGNSGKLVAQVKKNLMSEVGGLSDQALQESPFAVVDGSPGIGCPVISSMAGVDMVLIVAEPSVSGVSDVTRLLESIGRFGTKVAVCANKADINPVATEELKALCDKINVPYVGSIPYDHAFAQAVSEGEWNEDLLAKSSAFEEIKHIYDGVYEIIC